MLDIKINANELKDKIEKIQDLFNMLSPCMDNYMYIYDMQDDYYCISPNALERFAIPAAQFDNVEEHHAKFVYPADFQMLLASFSKLRDNHETFHNLEYRWLDREGKPVWICCRGQVIYEEEQPKYLVGCINEIGRQQKADNLSGLRREASLIQELTDRSEQQINGFIIRIGIDGFKEINENHGIEYGDMVLQKTAECIESVILPEQVGVGKGKYNIVINEMDGWEGSQLNKAKEILAYELTKLVHGEEEANKADASAKALFGGNGITDDMPTTEITEKTIGVLDLLVATKLTASKSEARRLVQGGGVSIDDRKIADPAEILEIDGSAIIKKGKKTYHKVVVK